jgi:hypothetical protein
MSNEDDIRQVIEDLDKKVNTAIKVDETRMKERYLTEADKNAHLAKTVLESGELFDFCYYKSLAQHCLDVADSFKAE